MYLLARADNIDLADLAVQVSESSAECSVQGLVFAVDGVTSHEI